VRDERRSSVSVRWRRVSPANGVPEASLGEVNLGCEPQKAGGEISPERWFAEVP